MTILTGNLQSVSGTPFGGPGHFVVIYSRITRPGFSADALILELQDRIPMTTTSGGSFQTEDLDPGPIRVELEGGTVHGRGWDIDLPESGTHSLANLIDAQVEWAPAVVSEVRALAQRVETVATTFGSLEGVATSVRAAEDAAASAEADRVVVEQAATSASWSGDRLTVLGATSPPLTGPVGPKGDIGPQGEVGPRGEKGEKGDTGDDGRSITVIGTVATVADLPLEGSLGDGYITDTDGHLHVWGAEGWTDVGEIRGPQGNPGERGPKGDKGDPGIQGVRGPEGPEGPEGPMGPEGPQGPPGDGGTGGTWALVATLPTSPDPDTLYLIPED